MAFDWFTDLLSNPVFAGVAGGAGMSALLYQARAIPRQAWNGARRLFSTTITIDNSDWIFEYVAAYFAAHKAVSKARWLRLVERFDEDDLRWRWRPTLGLGFHLIRDAGSWFFVHRHTDEKSGLAALLKRETLTITTIGRSHRSITGLVERAEAVFDGQRTVRVHSFHDGDYKLAERRPVRPMSTVYLPERQKAALIADVEAFAAARDTYRARGIPYRRGYLFEGPPGTGKTTLAFALAGHLGRPLYLVNLNTCGGDSGLQIALNRIEQGGIVVIEDIDSAAISHDRKAKSKAGSTPIEPAKCVTIAGLLNAVDGLASRESRILIMTSNHADKLDAALLRPGRVDRREHLGMVDEEVARAMVRSLAGNGADDAFKDEFASMLPCTPATLQGAVLARLDGERA